MRSTREWPGLLLVAMGARSWSFSGTGSDVDSGQEGAWPTHQEPAEVAQQAVARKVAPKEGDSADARKDAISAGSEGMAAVISSSVALAVSDHGALATAENRKKIGDMLTGCGSTCLALTGVATVESVGAAVPAVAACVPLVVAGSAISAFNDNALSTDELAHMMNANFDKLSEQIDQGFVSLADKLEGLVQDINKDQASKQFVTVSTINEFYRHMWVHIHHDALTDKSLPTEIQIVEFGAQLLPTALREYLQNALRSGAMILDVLRAAVGFVAARSQLYTMELLRCALDGHGACQPSRHGRIHEETGRGLPGIRADRPAVEVPLCSTCRWPGVLDWRAVHAMLAAVPQCRFGSQRGRSRAE